MGRYVPFSIGPPHVTWAAAPLKRSVAALTEQVTEEQSVDADIHREDNNHCGRHLILLHVGHQDSFHIRSSIPKYIIHTLFLPNHSCPRPLDWTVEIQLPANFW